MALKNAFEELAVESTANTTADNTSDVMWVLRELLKEQKITNMYLSVLADEEIEMDADDIEEDLL